jgi:hypothetical protein
VKAGRALELRFDLLVVRYLSSKKMTELIFALQFYFTGCQTYIRGWGLLKQKRHRHRWCSVRICRG